MSDLGYWKKKYSLTTGKKEKRKVVFMVINNPGCWICTSHKPNDKGYPQCKGERIVAIRMWEDKNKKSWPNGLVCIHSCDNAACINPDHVYPSTMKDNQSGMADRHRSPWGWRCGARKLTPEQAKEIYDLKGIESSSSIGKRYGVDHVTVLNIWKGTTWWRDVAGMGNFDVKLSSVKGMSGLLQRSEDESGVEYDGCVD